jgi:hypothetical protein
MAATGEWTEQQFSLWPDRPSVMAGLVPAIHDFLAGRDGKS